MSARLTDIERAERALSERALQSQVTDLAEALGWSWAHWRPLQNRRGFWQVPVEGPLGPGWPDLTLLRVRDRRLLFVELKRELERPSVDQAAVLAALAPLGGYWVRAPIDEGVYREPIMRVDVAVWRPSDLRDPIEASVAYQVLR